MKTEWVNNWGSIRRVTFLTPDTFLRKIRVISTTMNVAERKGETAIADAHALNFLCVNLQEVEWKVIKKHSSIEEALAFHEKTEKETVFGDTKKVKL